MTDLYFRNFYYKFHGYQPRPWGYEVRADVWDLEDNHYPLCFTFKEKPDEKVLIKETERRLWKLEQDLNELEEIVRYPEVDEILIEKGYLKEGQHFPDDLGRKKILGIF